MSYGLEEVGGAAIADGRKIRLRWVELRLQMDENYVSLSSFILLFRNVEHRVCTTHWGHVSNNEYVTPSLHGLEPTQLFSLSGLE